MTKIILLTLLFSCASHKKEYNKSTPLDKEDLETLLETKYEKFNNEDY